jgi:hypothetical protein
MLKSGRREEVISDAGTPQFVRVERKARESAVAGRSCRGCKGGSMNSRQGCPQCLHSGADDGRYASSRMVDFGGWLLLA